jgi:hypothetical protein
MEHASNDGSTSRPDDLEWDLFIAHASEDKDDFVRPLAEWLDELGAHVWYDEFQLRPGDSLIAAIDRGLASSRFGLLILSKAFLAKPWPDYERRGLTTRELAGSNVVIPVWREVTHADVVAFSPPLADKYALTEDSVNTLGLEVLRVVRPDLFQDLARRAALESRLRDLPTETVDIDRVSLDTPIRRQTLPKSLMYRLLLIHESLFDVLPIPFEETVRNFQRDMRPEREVEIWERLAAVYLHILREDEIPPDGRKEVLNLALKASMGSLWTDDNDGLKYTTVTRFEEVERLLVERVSMLEGASDTPDTDSSDTGA